jgi:hypothetical protein
MEYVIIVWLKVKTGYIVSLLWEKIKKVNPFIVLDAQQGEKCVKDVGVSLNVMFSEGKQSE